MDDMVIFSQPTMQTHFDPTRRLFLDIDASKGYGYGVMVYHAKSKEKINTIASSAAQPTLPLPKILTLVEMNYWPTKLELACLVWTGRETRHTVRAAEQPTVVFTDHILRLNIVKQNTFSFFCL
jgi:hypothetical protein